MAMTLVPKQ